MASAVAVAHRLADHGFLRVARCVVGNGPSSFDSFVVRGVGHAFVMAGAAVVVERLAEGRAEGQFFGVGGPPESSEPGAGGRPWLLWFAAFRRAKSGPDGRFEIRHPSILALLWLCAVLNLVHAIKVDDGEVLRRPCHLGVDLAVPGAFARHPLP